MSGLQRISKSRNSSRFPRDFVLPTLLFMALGGMTWAVRGCSGFGAVDGCVFAGVTWGAGWWFLSRGPGGRSARPYASGLVILALTLGIGFSGSRGWMQWPSFFDGHLQTNTEQGQWLPISRAYGFLWLFIAGVPWAGLGACALAWCGTHQRISATAWVARVACGVTGALIGRFLVVHFPEIFLPLYHSAQAQYADLAHNPNLRRLMGDNRLAMLHLGAYLGFLAFEVARRDWRNVTLILTVGLVNGIGWAAFQNWSWARRAFPDGSFNFWRCWESSGGVSIGFAYGLAFFLANRPTGDTERAETGSNCPNLERFGAWLGLIYGLGLSIKNCFKGWTNIYIGNEAHWNRVGWAVMGPLMILAVGFVAFRLRSRPLPRGTGEDLFPWAGAMIWTVLIVQNLIAQLVTGPHSSWPETAFAIYYALLFCISAVIVYHHGDIITSSRREG